MLKENGETQICDSPRSAKTPRLTQDLEIERYLVCDRLSSRFPDRTLIVIFSRVLSGQA